MYKKKENWRQAELETRIGEGLSGAREKRGADEEETIAKKKGGLEPREEGSPYDL